MLKVVHDAVEPNENDIVAGRSLLDEIVRDGARQMLAAAPQAEVAAYIEAHAGEVDEHGHRPVIRNGYHLPREVTLPRAPYRCGRRGSTTSASTRSPASASGSPRRSAGLVAQVPADGRGATAAVFARPVQLGL